MRLTPTINEPNHTLERIQTNGHYEPNNVCWATRKEQANNRRDNRLLTFAGTVKTLTAWAESLGVHPMVIHSRLKRGWTLERALTTPSKRQK